MILEVFLQFSELFSHLHHALRQSSHKFLLFENQSIDDDRVANSNLSFFYINNLHLFRWRNAVADQAVTIRPIKEGEKKALKQIMNDAFPFFMRLFFSFSKHTLVAEKNGKIVGGVILKIFMLQENVKAGLVSLIFCSPQHAGLGIGQSLSAAGLKTLEQNGCTQLFACVEGNNTSSSKLFSNSGFSRLSLFEQLKTYKLNNLRIWLNSFHFFDIGFFMWAKSTDNLPAYTANSSTSRSEWLFTLFSHVLILTVSLWRQGEADFLVLENILTLVATFAVFYGIRYGAMLSIAWYQKQQVEFKMWESGLVLSGLIAVLFGGFMAAPGSLYPVEKNWRYKDHIPQLGKMALVSSVCLISLIWCIGLLLNHNFIVEHWLHSLETAFLVGTGLLVVDVTLPFFPFSSFNGRRLWDWNKLAWGILTLSIIPLVVLI